MMKKISKLALLAVATAFLLASFPACSNDGDGDGNKQDVPGGDKNDPDTPSAPKAEVSSWTFGDLQGVPAKIRKATAEIDNKTSPNASAVEALADVLEAFPTHTATTDYLQYFYILEDVTYKATSGDKTMTILAKSDAENYNFHNRYYGTYTSSSITEKVSAGCIEIKGDAFSIADMQGPFTVTVLSTANGSSTQTDRGAYIKVGATLADATAASAAASASSASPAGDKLTYAYSGTNKQTIVIGAAGGKSIRVFDVSVEEINTVVAVESVTISSADSVSELTVGGKTTLTATVSPESATDKTVTWSVTGEDGTSETTAASVEGGVVTAKSVTADTVVKVFAKAGGKTSEAYSITIKPEAVVAGEATVKYFVGSAEEEAEYSATGITTDESIVIAKDIVIAWGNGVSSQFTESNTGIYTTNSIKGYGIQSEKIKTDAADGEKFDFVQSDEEILTVTATLTPKKNLTVKEISGQFVNGKSGNTVLFINGTNTGLAKNKTLTLEKYKPASEIKGTAGQDLTITFTIKASGKLNVTAKDFQWTQVMNDIKIVVAAEEE